MSRIFFPLRSNSAWFLADETKDALEMRIKMSLMLYDEVVFQDALYQCTIWENGTFDMLLPPPNIGFDRSKIRYYKPGTKSSLIVGLDVMALGHTIISMSSIKFIFLKGNYISKI